MRPQPQELGLLLLLLLSSVPVLAQSYQPVIQPDKTWEMMECDRVLICSVQGGAQYHFEGDTLLNGRTYAKLYGRSLISPWGNSPYCPPFAVAPEHFLSDTFIREDTVAQRIYRYQPEAPELETLVFDLNTQEGGSVLGLEGEMIVIDSIRMMVLQDGIPRRAFYFGWSGAFVEGIGCLDNFGGAFDPPALTVPHCQVVRCVMHNGIELRNAGYACSGPLSTTDLPPIHPAQAYPNPASDKVVLAGGPKGMWLVQVYDHQGREVVQGSFQGEEPMDVSALMPGVYSYQLSSERGMVHHGRFNVAR
jgi:hypothetical protein